MRYSIESRDGFLPFAKNMGKSLSNKYGQKLLDSAKKSTTDSIKTASERAIQKTAEATGDFIGNKLLIKRLRLNCILKNYLIIIIIIIIIIIMNI